MSYKLPLFAAAAFLGGYMLISNRQLRVNEYELKVSKLPEKLCWQKDTSSCRPAQEALRGQFQQSGKFLYCRRA
ncbi:hypothetical protein [Ruminococcus sp.]|uniref:hypothetical protein n=1 Tax=Ruminococcus sp. TaxID=41978 RepID=UPI003520B75E